MKTSTHSTFWPVWRRVTLWGVVMATLGVGSVSLVSGVLAKAKLTNQQTAPYSPAVQTALQAKASDSPVSGELMAHSCAACHGTQGRLGDEAFMPLAGMPVGQFVSTMVDFREGTRPATLMGHVAQGFNDAQLRAMADYFAAIRPQEN